MENNELIQMLRTVIQEELKPINERLDRIDNRLDHIDTRLDNLEGQLGENTGLVRSLLHRTEELSAQFDGLLHNTVTKECISTLATKENVQEISKTQAEHSRVLELLSTRSLKQEAEINYLKIAK